MTMTDVTTNLAQVRETIASACARANRSEDDITLVAISKQKPAQAIIEAYEAGVRHFGENRVGEALGKIPQVNQRLPDDDTPVWHMVGHIQSRKAKDVVPLFNVVQSVDRLKIADYLSRIGGEEGYIMPVFIEINISGEDAKYGFEASDWQHKSSVKDALWDAMRTMIELPHLDIRGLMTLAPFYDKVEKTRPVFAALAELRGALRDDFDIALPELSMGMTNDYPVAIEEGATMVRIGRAIFGERD